MSIKDLFRPKWKHSDKEIRKIAISKISDQALLEEIARTDDDFEVQILAIRGIKDQNNIIKIYSSEKDTLVQEEIIKSIDAKGNINFLNSVINNNKDFSLRYLAYEKLGLQDSEKALRDCITNSKDFSKRKIAYKKLGIEKEKEALVDCMLNETSREDKALIQDQLSKLYNSTLFVTWGNNAISLAKEHDFYVKPNSDLLVLDLLGNLNKFIMINVGIQCHSCSTKTNFHVKLLTGSIGSKELTCDNCGAVLELYYDERKSNSFKLMFIGCTPLSHMNFAQIPFITEIKFSNEENFKKIMTEQNKSDLGKNNSSNKNQFGQFIDPRDEKIYKTIKIGDQIWLAENLAFKKSNGCWPPNGDSKNVEKYGYLYDFKTALEISPPGWHLPSDNEWDVLINYLGGPGIAGGKMKEKTGWNSPNIGATNESGFSALPAGTRDQFIYWYIGINAFFWTSSGSIAEDSAWSRGMSNEGENIDPSGNVCGVNCFSVRCVKDKM